VFIDTLARLWSVKDSLPLHADVIALVSFASTGDALTRGSTAVTQKAATLAKQFPTARIIFGEFTLNPVRGVEQKLKEEMFPNSIFAGYVVSTIEEGEKHKTHMLSVRPRSIIVISDQWHSRSAKLVWKKLWHKQPRVTISVIAVPSHATVGPENPMLPLRNQWTWALVNVLRHMFLVFVPGGFSIMKQLNIHQPT
jgi:uncharacterized SAM-binding protein YcdF (DUF218 family)